MVLHLVYPHVSGTTTLNNATPLLSSLNVVGNIIGSGTALTNLNYNAITNKPDLTVYATNTNLNSLSQYSTLNINYLQDTYIQDNYTQERQYPPKRYNSSTNETTTTLLNKTVFTQTITLNTTEITYGSGDYILYSSSVFLIGDQNLYRKRDLFNFNTVDVGGHWDLNYSTPENYYGGTNFIKNEYLGDWIIIKLPTPIILSKFRFYNRIGLITQAPSLWKCYGSNDGITFTEIIEASYSTQKVTEIYNKVTEMYKKVT